MQKFISKDELKQNSAISGLSSIYIYDENLQIQKFCFSILKNNEIQIIQLIFSFQLQIIDNYQPNKLQYLRYSLQASVDKLQQLIYFNDRLIQDCISQQKGDNIIKNRNLEHYLGIVNQKFCQSLILQKSYLITQSKIKDLQEKLESTQQLQQLLVPHFHQCYAFNISYQKFIAQQVNLKRKIQQAYFQQYKNINQYQDYINNNSSNILETFIPQIGNGSVIYDLQLSDNKITKCQLLRLKNNKNQVQQLIAAPFISKSRLLILFIVNENVPEKISSFNKILGNKNLSYYDKFYQKWYKQQSVTVDNRFTFDFTTQLPIIDLHNNLKHLLKQFLSTVKIESIQEQYDKLTIDEELYNLPLQKLYDQTIHLNYLIHHYLQIYNSTVDEYNVDLSKFVPRTTTLQDYYNSLPKPPEIHLKTALDHKLTQINQLIKGGYPEFKKRLNQMQKDAK